MLEIRLSYNHICILKIKGPKFPLTQLLKLMYSSLPSGFLDCMCGHLVFSFPEEDFFDWIQASANGRNRLSTRELFGLFTFSQLDLNNGVEANASILFSPIPPSLLLGPRPSKPLLRR